MTEKNVIYQEKEETLSFVQIGMEILRVARNELYLNMRFLDVALSNLRFVPDGQIRGLGTDGNNLYFQPDGVVALFRKGRPVINRAYLHSIVHCLFCHLWNRKDRDAEYWNLACDIAAESIIDDLYLKAVHVPKRQVRREYYRKLKERGGVVTAERVYRSLPWTITVSGRTTRIRRRTVRSRRGSAGMTSGIGCRPKWRHFRKKRRMMCALWRRASRRRIGSGTITGNFCASFRY